MMVLSTGLFALWQNSVRQTEAITARQSAYENARISIDGLLTNINMSYRLDLSIDNEDNLRILLATGLDASGNMLDFRFDFNINARPSDVRYYRRLVFGTNEFASGIASVVMTVDCEYNPQRMYVTVTTICDIQLHGSADVRFKDVIVQRV